MIEFQVRILINVYVPCHWHGGPLVTTVTPGPTLDPDGTGVHGSAAVFTYYAMEILYGGDLSGRWASYIYFIFQHLVHSKTLQYTGIKQSFGKLNLVYSLTVEVIQKLDGYQGSLRLSCWSPIRKTKEALTLPLLHDNFNATEIQNNTKQWKKI